jgi:hypothetical protein
MFLDSAGRILDRHVPTAEVNHATAHGTVRSVERSSFEFWSDSGHFRRMHTRI